MKNNPGGLKNRNKQVTQYANSERPDLCFFYKEYSHWPTDVTGDVFYLFLCQNLKGWCGVRISKLHTLATTVKWLCENRWTKDQLFSKGYNSHQAISKWSRRAVDLTQVYRWGQSLQGLWPRAGRAVIEGVE